MFEQLDLGWVNNFTGFSGVGNNKLTNVNCIFQCVACDPSAVPKTWCLAVYNLTNRLEAIKCKCKALREGLINALSR